MKYSLFLLLFVICSLFTSCDEEKSKQPFRLPSKKETSKINQVLIEEADDDINLYINRHQWDMISTGTGLRYMIYHQSNVNSDSAKVGMIAKVNFEISGLDGTNYYSSKESGTSTFKIEHADVEAGIHEGVQYMTVGDKAKIILPPHLAHGVSGDMNKILPYTTLVYDIELLELAN